MMGRLWWGAKENEMKIAWMSWDWMGRSKDKGEMGSRDLENFNMALLAKQGWRLINNPETLLARIYKEKYYTNGNFLDVMLGNMWRKDVSNDGKNLQAYPSYAWRSI
jgi:hypothetical protein